MKGILIFSFLILIYLGNSLSSLELLRINLILLQDVAGLVGGGGVSIYYSHTLKMLFFSYAQGKSFLAPLNTVEESVQGTYTNIA